MYCKQCGIVLPENAKFCRSCGAKVNVVEGAKVNVEAAESQRTTSVPERPTPVPAWKRKRSSGKLVISAIAVLLVIVLAVVILPRVGGKPETGTDPDSKAIDLSALSYTEKDYEANAQEFKVTAENPVASAYDVTIDFGEYGIDGSEKLQIRELPEKTDKSNGVKVTAYDFYLGGQTVFDDVITIAIPYDEKYVEAGAEGECIGAKYYNRSTGEWEGVLYEVDAENRQVLIYTTHLSTYGVFQVKNENTRKAYITDVYAIASQMNTGKSFEVLQELADSGEPGNAAFEAGFEAINTVTGNTGTAITAITLGGQYDGALVEALDNRTQHLGLALAVVQTCYDFTYNFSDDSGKLSTLSNLVKNIANNAVGYLGSSALKVGFAGIAVFDIILSTVQSDMVELKLENIGDVYQYYNDVEATRSNKEWRKIMIRILNENQDDPQKAQQLIEQEIDDYCNRFWELGYGKVKEIAGVSGKKYSFDEREWTKDREVLTQQYRAHLLTRLQAPMISARKYLLNKAMEQAQREFEKQLRSLQRELNKTVRVQIIEQPDSEGEYKYTGYTVRFAPLSNAADVKNWTGKMPGSGTMNTSFTILGHMQCGLPNTIELYAPGKDTPELTVPFKVSYPTTTIQLGGNNEEKTEQVEIDDSEETTEEPATAPAAQKEYAWVLVNTINEVYQANLDSTNKDGVYQVSATASPGSYTYSKKYMGESDTWYDPDMIHGESYATQLTVSVPPEVIRGGETVSLSFNLAFTDENLSFFDGTESCRADFGSTRFANEDGKRAFEIYSSVKYSEKNVSSVSGTISAEIPVGYSEGQQEELWTGGGNSGTRYIYEWRPIS